MKSKSRTKIVLVAGARPNFMKVAPIIRELQKSEDTFAWKLVHTGQHYDHGMSEIFFKELGIPEPDYHMGAGGGTHAEQTARIMVAFEGYCKRELPELVLVVGDVDSTLACAIVAKKLGIDVAHVEAGLRSGDMRMPEEINRKVTDSISDYFFVTEKSGLENLRREGHPDEVIFYVGHVMIDNLFYQIDLLKNLDTGSFPTVRIKERFSDGYGVVTLHRPSNVDEERTLVGLVGVLGEVSRSIPLVFAIHPRTRANLNKFQIMLPDSIVTTEPLPYMEFLNLWKDARVIFTDSGGLQEESTALGIPCITLRENTERPATVDEGTNIVAGNSPERIRDIWRNHLVEVGKRRGRRPHLWDGNAAKRIVDALSRAYKKQLSD